MITAQALLRVWFLAGSWFYFDDLAFLSAGMNDPLDWTFVGRDYAGHLMPAGWLVIKALATWAPYDWAAWAAVLVVLQGIASLRHAPAAALDVRRPRTGRPGAARGLPVLRLHRPGRRLVRRRDQPAAAPDRARLRAARPPRLPAHHRRCALAQYVGLDGLRPALLREVGRSLRPLRVGRARLVREGHAGQRLSSLWSTYRIGSDRPWSVACRTSRSTCSTGFDLGGDSTPSSLLAAVAYRLVGRRAEHRVIGGPFEWRAISANALADPSDLVSLISWVAVGALVWYALRTRTMSRRAWWLLAADLRSERLPAGRRAGHARRRRHRHSSTATRPRPQSSVVLAVGLAFLLRCAARSRSTRCARTSSDAVDRRGPVGLVTVVVVAAPWCRRWPTCRTGRTTTPTPDYYDNVRTSAAATRDIKQVPLVDGSLPQTLLWAFGYPENTYSHVFRNLAELTRYPDHSVDHLFTLNDPGQRRWRPSRRRRVMLPRSRLRLRPEATSPR